MPSKISGKCELCITKDALYRCPQCYVKYCSLGCYKPHKEKCSPKQPSQVSTPQITSNMSMPQLHLQLSEEEEGTDRVRSEVLARLGESKELKTKLSNDYLKDMLKDIVASHEPSNLIEKCMQIPIFNEFVDECLNVVEPSKDVLIT